MPVKVSLSNGRGSRWAASQVFQSENVMQSTARRSSTSYGQTLYVGAGKKACPSTSQMGAKTRSKASYMTAVSSTAAAAPARVAAPAPTPVPAVQYHAAGQSWCGYSRQQKAILEHPSNQGKTQVQYTDCSKGGPNVQHPVCNLQARGFPYLARCTGSKCSIVKYGRHHVEDLNKHVAADQEQQK